MAIKIAALILAIVGVLVSLTSIVICIFWGCDIYGKPALTEKRKDSKDKTNDSNTPRT